MRKLRTVLVLAALTCVGIGVAPLSAYAWTSDGMPIFKRGAKHTIGYYAVGAAAASESRDAVKHWNESGAKLRLVPVARSKALIVVTPAFRHAECYGMARRVVVDGVRRSSVIKRSLCRSREDRVNILVHEFGHSLGLEHEDRRCAAMNDHMVDGIPFKCTDAIGLPAWRYRCTVLEVDDIRGMVARYGGRVKAPKQRICDRGPAPAAPTGLAVSFSALEEFAADATITWVHPPAPAAIVRMWIYEGACPPPAGHYALFNGFDTAVVPSAPASRLITRMTPGPYCAELQSLDEWEQPSAMVHHPFVVPGTVG